MCSALALVSVGCSSPKGLDDASGEGGASAAAGSTAAAASGAGDAASGATSAGGANSAGSSDTGSAGLGAASGAEASAQGGAALGGGGSVASAGSAGSAPTAGSGGSAASLTTKDFACSEVIGLWVASQWWDTFEKGVDTAHWQFMFQHHGYLELFADPASPYWANAVSSNCTTGSAAPDRVIFLPFSLSLMTLEQWLTNLKQVVDTMKGKFPGVKRIELMTTLRSPGNMPCANDTDPNTVVQPYVDQAIQMVADASGGLVTVGPKIELTSCSWWAGGTDLTGPGNTGVGQLLAAYYQTH
ncbi:MAG TPA: hypothetical protein VGL19_18485 [Polyangiaceae bacterium]|jgi:hypothetical protein